MAVFPEYESMNDLGAGVPVLPLRRTFFPGASGLEQTPQEQMSGGMPILPLRRTFPPGASGLGAGVPVLPLRRTFFPGASGFGQMPATVKPKPKMMGRWVILDSNGKVVALIAGKIKKLGGGYTAKKVGEYIEGGIVGMGQQVYENQTLVGMGQDEVSPGSTPWEKAERYYEMNKSAFFGLGRRDHGPMPEGAPVTTASKYAEVEEEAVSPESTPWEKAERYANMNRSEMFGLGDVDAGMFGPEPTERMSDMKGLF